MKKYLEPHRRLQETLEKHLKPQRLLQEQISKYLLPLNRYLSDPMMSSVSINSDGTAFVGGEVVNVENVSESVEVISADYDSHVDFISHFFEWLERLSDSVRVIVIYLILPYLLAIVANLTTPIYEEWWKEYSGLDPRVAKKEIVREADETYRPEDLRGYRFVYATSLHVRESGSKKADIIDDLPLGKTVKVIDKSKHWSFIEYQDSDTGELKQGWVFSRYLKRFSK